MRTSQPKRLSRRQAACAPDADTANVTLRSVTLSGTVVAGFDTVVVK